MKIKRIKEIKNIGTFADFNGCSFEFEDLTFIYGLNTFGKTTLTDIFQSLKNNDPSLVISRKTIPYSTTSQKIGLSIIDESLREKDLVFQNQTWGNNKISEYIEVFGTEFIHKNVFTGLTIERDNKKNFTDFILGEEGGRIAEKIESDKKIIREKNANSKNLIPRFVKGKSQNEIDKFLKFDITTLDKNYVDKKLIELQSQKNEEQKRLQEPQKIINLSDIKKAEIPEFTITKSLEIINNCLGQDYSNIKEEVLNGLNSHVNQHFVDTQNSSNWIKQGFDNTKKNKNKNCLFCGQSIIAKDENDEEKFINLVNLYDKYFDIEYTNYINKVGVELDRELKSIDKVSFGLEQKFVIQYNIAQNYKELIIDQDFQDLLTDFEQKLKNIKEDDLEFQQKVLVTDIKLKIEQKNRKPYTSISKVNFSEFNTNLETYLNNLLEVNNIIESIAQNIVIFKEKYRNLQSIKDIINLLNIQITDLEYQKNRIEQDEECKTYQQELMDIRKMEDDKKINKLNLENQQSQYLEKYFDKINTLFKKFGSHNFKLERKNENNGDKPVYTLKIIFHDCEITNEQLRSVFSESDRRALALAIFWAKITLKTDEEKTKTIIILDDPITSFDDNRITNTIDLFKIYLEKVSQIIILTHYPNFIKIFSEKTKEDTITKFFEIEKDQVTSKIKNIERKVFIESDYEKIFTKINNYIERISSDCIKTDLRPFLENLYLPTFFAKQLRTAKKSGKDLSSLKNIINEIFTDEIVKARFQTFRKNTNPDSHIFTSNNKEDVINFAEDMMEYLYSFNF